MWKGEYEHWTRRDLRGKNFVYLWVDGVHFGVRLEDASQCILVVIGATVDGKKELLAMLDGYRESASAWKEPLVELKQRGLTIEPKLAIGDGALGFWKALPQAFCKTASNVAGCIRQPTRSTNCPKLNKPKPRLACMGSRWLRVAPRRSKPSLTFDNL